MSHERAEAMIEAHVMNPNERSLCVRETQSSLSQSVKHLLETKIVSMGVGHYFDIQRDCIRPTKGDGSGIITFKGMQNYNSDSVKSLEDYDRAWWEEAQNASQVSLDLLRPTIMRKKGAEMWFTWNPGKSTDPIELLLRCDDPPPGSTVVQVNYEDNPWMDETALLEMEYDKKRDPDKYAHVWRGKYEQRSEARVFNNWRVEEFEAPEDAVHNLGSDFGFSIDPTTLIRSHTIGRKMYIDYEGFMIGCEIVDTPALYSTVPESDKWPMIADSARPETISHCRKNGYPKIMSAVKGPNSVVEGIEWLKSYEMIVHPRCVHTIDELTAYKYKIDTKTDMVTNILEDKNNHIIDALRYSNEAARRMQKAKVVAVAPIPTVSNWG